MADASQKGLQLLVDSFAGTDDTEERDELLQDIIAHPAPQALGFLRLVADNGDEDRYLRCDAICAICVRTGGKEQIEPVLLYLDNPYDAYEYSSACQVVAELKFADAAPLILAQFDMPLEEACLDASVQALEAVGAAQALASWLEKQGGTVDEARAILVCGAIERLRKPGTEKALLGFAEKMRAHPQLVHLAAAATDAAEAMAKPLEEDADDEA